MPVARLRPLIPAVAALGLFAAAEALPAAEPLAVPLTIAPSVVRRVLIEQAFPQTGARVYLIGGQDQCSFFLLQDPEVVAEEGRIRIVARGEARFGTEFLGLCLRPFTWVGRLELHQAPRLEDARLRFEVVDSSLTNPAGSKTTLSARVWALVKPQLHPHFAAVTIDLEPALGEIRQLLAGFLDAESAPIAATLRPLTAAAQADGVRVVIGLDAPPAGDAQESPAPLSAEEIEAFVRHLDEWDAFLTFTVREIAAGIGGQDLGATLLAVLIEGRYAVIDALTTPQRSPDPVRALFVSAWEQLRPIVQDLAAGREAPGAIELLTFIGAGDLLLALDELGPAVGIEISAEGLRRMARLVAPDITADPLAFGVEVDAELRRRLGFDADDVPDDAGSSQAALGRPLWQLLQWLAAPSLAADEPWRGWTFSGRTGAKAHVARVASLLDRTVEQTVARRKLQGDRATRFRPLFLATAWQESCWRQFRVRQGEVVPLRSAQGSVGILQINERVWRNFYKPESLRWDIAYNAHAGAEILDQYVAMARKELGSVSALEEGRAAYAAYNGGPRQLRLYASGQAGPKLRRVIDELFDRKLRTSIDDMQPQVVRCLVG